MIIRFTNARPTEIFHFMDGTKKNLRLVACSFLNGYEFVNETILQVIYNISLDCKKCSTDCRKASKHCNEGFPP